jgi:hypothetical protein
MQAILVERRKLVRQGEVHIVDLAQDVVLHCQLGYHRESKRQPSAHQDVLHKVLSVSSYTSP